VFGNFLLIGGKTRCLGFSGQSKNQRSVSVFRPKVVRDKDVINGAEMAEYDWIVEVCRDIGKFAEENSMHHLVNAVRHAEEMAVWEIDQRQASGSPGDLPAETPLTCDKNGKLVPFRIRTHNQ